MRKKFNKDILREEIAYKVGHGLEFDCKHDTYGTMAAVSF